MAGDLKMISLFQRAEIILCRAVLKIDDFPAAGTDQLVLMAVRRGEVALAGAARLFGLVQDAALFQGGKGAVNGGQAEFFAAFFQFQVNVLRRKVERLFV